MTHTDLVVIMETPLNNTLPLKLPSKPWPILCVRTNLLAIVRLDIQVTDCNKSQLLWQKF